MVTSYDRAPSSGVTRYATRSLEEEKYVWVSFSVLIGHGGRWRMSTTEAICRWEGIDELRVMNI